MSGKKQTSSRPVGFGGPMRGPMVGGKPQNFGKSTLKLIAYLRPFAVLVALSLLLNSAATLLSIIAPSYVGSITDELYKAYANVQIDTALVTKLAITLVIFYGTSWLLSCVDAYIMAGVNNRITQKMRSQISDKINRLPLSYFDNHSVGETSSRVSNAVDTVGQMLNQSLGAIFTSSIMIVGVLIAMFVTCWQLGITAVVTVPLGVFLIITIMGVAHRHFAVQQQAIGDINGHIEEAYTGHNIIKAFNGEGKSRRKFDAINLRLYKATRVSQFMMGLMMPMMGLLSNIGTIAICVVGGALFASGQIHDPGIIASFFIYLRLFQNAMNQIAQAMGNLQSAVASGERVFSMLESEEQSDESDKPVHDQPVRGEVEFCNVSFGYTPEHTVIKNFSAKILPGQKVAIVGPTGAGKTTLINLLMRFYELGSGEILIDGTPISALRREDVRAMFGMVLQDTWLFEGTIRENIVYAKTDVSEDEIIRAAQAANIDHYIRTLPHGYDMRLDDEISISGGQRQLLTIARAMVQNAPMIILDEATSNVDTRTEQAIQDAMDSVTKGRTSFVIAHRLSTIRNADLILVMNNGDIVESGTHDELLASKGFYSELYLSQFVTS